jgi:hypothetical protein
MLLGSAKEPEVAESNKYFKTAAAAPAAAPAPNANTAKRPSDSTAEPEYSEDDELESFLREKVAGSPPAAKKARPQPAPAEPVQEPAPVADADASSAPAVPSAKKKSSKDFKF